MNFSKCDRRRICLAEAWLLLGDPKSAKNQLDGIGARLQSHPRVLELRCAQCEQAQDWRGLLLVSRVWASQQPTNAKPWTDMSVALDGLGRTEEAISLLETKRKLVEDDSEIPLHMACFYGKLRLFRKARKWLMIAVQSRKKWDCREAVLGDPKLNSFLRRGRRENAKGDASEEGSD